MLSPPEQQEQGKKNPMSHLLENISSYDGNVMLAAVISLLLVILFVLLLHIYAKWFLQQARHRRRSRSRSRRDPSTSMSMSNMLGPAGRFHHFHNFPFDNNNDNSIPNSVSSKGLEASTIASIPLFVYCSNNNNGEDDGIQEGLECVVCLSVFEESDVCRCLPKCGHSFHVECIDMWLHSHTNCPICRAPVVSEKMVAMELVHDHNDNDYSVEAAGTELVEIVVVVNVEQQQQARESSNCENSCDHDQIQDVGLLLNHDRSSSSSSSASGSSSLGSSLKRMLSRNSRSDHHQSKVFPSSSDHHNNNPNIVELDG
ncbi:hypothetical protein Ddye_025258 [Dipteronia dyeriana]|uniref:RING-type domain-containing protein n=1 Tax=Dipteronia dyeriana TaxID=168575 RepID=A0AAD9TXD7_9ROSI|nr:hypothetical protein Ddye_025258 [Dipteronia dyeriana]